MTDDEIKAARELCADLADNGPGRSGAYELELRCKAARLLPAMLDEIERLHNLLDSAFTAGWDAGWDESGEGHNNEHTREYYDRAYFDAKIAEDLAQWRLANGL